MVSTNITVGALTCTSWILLYLPIVWMTNSIVTEPYMDEPFHVNQVLEIYNHPLNPKWDPKITTPSGLYYTTLALTGWFVPPTSLGWLRMTSALLNSLAMSATVLLVRSRSKMHHKSVVSSWLTGLKIMTFPPLFFVGQLYYTDPGSLLFIVLAWFALHHYHLKTSLVLSSVAIWFRQTNAVWVVFLGGLYFAERLNVAVDDPQSFNLQLYVNAALFNEKFKFKRVVMESMGFLLIPVAYVLVTFAQNRGALVHGDESNHQLSMHWAQVCYFSLVILISSGLGFQLVFAPKQSASLLARNWGAFALCLSLSFCMVYKYSITHPFLLADNRHFSFYLWSRFFRKYDVAKYVPIPIYAIGMFFGIQQIFKGTKSFLITLGFIVASSLSLVPLPLFEPRYFIVPLTVYSVLTIESESKQENDRNNVLVILLNAIVNAVVASLFWFHPFQWPDGSIARFMW